MSRDNGNTTLNDTRRIEDNMMNSKSTTTAAAPPAPLAEAGMNALTTAPVQAAPAAAAVQPSPLSPNGACVGVPVQYSNEQEIIPAVLQRLGKDSLWDVKIAQRGAAVFSTRMQVPFSPDGPKPGHWNFLPGWEKLLGA